MATAILEQELSRDLKDLLRRGIDELTERPAPFDASDVVKLEKLTRIYSILMADVRETVKVGLHSLDDEALDELAEL